jgi:hypothetical protein
LREKYEKMKENRTRRGKKGGIRRNQTYFLVHTFIGGTYLKC